MTSRRRYAVLLVLMFAAVLAGCSDQADPDPSAGRQSEPSTTSTPPAESPGPKPQASVEPSSGPAADVEVPEVLRFEASTLDGSAFDGGSLAGKPTVFWFWAPWCTVCLSQVPEVEGVAEEYAGDVNVVGVGGLDSESAIEDFAADLDGMVLLADDGTLWQRFGITEQSSFVILDANGQEVARSGYDGELDVSAEVAGLLD